VYVSSVAWSDYDNDGLLDFLLEGLSGNTFITELWRNTGNGFVNVPVPGLPGFADGSLAWGDFDNDGRPDFLITGLTNGTTEVSQVWRNTGSGFTNVPVPGLPGNFDNSVAWGDYDNDGQLDFLVTGIIDGGNASQLWRNSGLSSNAPSVAPAGLSATVTGSIVVLKWNPPADDHTPVPGLSYNVRIGTTPGGVDIISPGADPATGVRRVAALGNLGENLSATVFLPPGHYYWSVQAVDTSFAGSPFADEQQFSIGPVIVNPIHHANGVFEFDFTNRTALSFNVLASTDVVMPSTNWANLGPATSLGGGLYRFTDASAIGQPQRYYRLRQQ
jgi:hypothetical protein